MQKKTKAVCFRKKSQKIELNNLHILLDGEKLKFEEDARFLGIILDSHLSWEGHCNQVANTISRNNALINQVKKMLPSPSLKMLYNSFILPHLQYGLAAWGGCSNQIKKRIVGIQKRAIRTVSKSYITSHTEPRMKNLGLLKLDDLYTQQCTALIYDIKNHFAPPALGDLLPNETAQSHHHLRSHVSDPNHVRTPVTRSKVSSNSFFCKGPLSWNSLPQEIQNARSRHAFKSQLKTRFLDSYEHIASCNNPRCNDRRHH